MLGASGLVGNAAVRRFLDDDDYEVVTGSRRVPELPRADRLTRLSLDLQDAAAVTAAVRDYGPFTHVVYAALFEKPNLIAGWVDPEQVTLNRLMLVNLLEALQRSGPPPNHISVLQGTKAYGYHLGPIRIPAKESQPRVEHDNFYFEQEDLLRATVHQTGTAFTIFRPQFVLGAAVGAHMSLIPVIGVYAALCNELGQPFSYPGGSSYIAEGVDTRLLADALHWAATETRAHDQIFNITNGDVFEWRDLWPSFAECLQVAIGPDERLSLSEWLPQQEDAWRRLVARHGLQARSLRDTIGQSHQFADDAFAYTLDGSPSSARSAPVLLSTIKLRQAGFSSCIDTAAAFRYWFDHLRTTGVLP